MSEITTEASVVKRRPLSFVGGIFIGAAVAFCASAGLYQLAKTFELGEIGEIADRNFERGIEAGIEATDRVLNNTNGATTDAILCDVERLYAPRIAKKKCGLTAGN